MIPFPFLTRVYNPYRGFDPLPSLPVGQRSKNCSGGLILSEALSTNPCRGSVPLPNSNRPPKCLATNGKDFIGNGLKATDDENYKIRKVAGQSE